MFRRKDIYFCNFGVSNTIGSEQMGRRPVLILQNDIGNKFSSTVIVATITSQTNKAKLPTHVEISAKDYGLNRDSLILLEQIRTVDKSRLEDYKTTLTDEDMKKVDQAMLISLGINIDNFINQMEVV